MLRIEAKKKISKEDLGSVSEILSSGGVGIIPTDTVYGLAAQAFHAGAVSRIYKIKQRPKDKALPVLMSEVSEVEKLVVAESPAVKELMNRFWPGPLTIVMRRLAGVDLPYQNPESLAVRVPDSQLCLALIKRAGFLVMPSANFSGEPPPVSPDDVSRALLGLVDFFIHAEVCPCGIESTVVDATEQVRVLRVGAIPADDIMNAVSGRSDRAG